MNPSGGNSRYTSLLSMFGLSDRIVFDRPVNMNLIDYSKVNNILTEQRKRSLSFLQKKIALF